MIESKKMKNKTVLIFGAIAAIVVIFGAGFMLLQKSSMVPQNSSTTSSGSSSSAKSLKDLMASGQSQKCTFTDMISGSDASGTFYVSSGKVRGDYAMQVDGKETMGHMIFVDNTSYMWMDGQTTGFKMGLDPESLDSQASSDGSQKTVDVNKNIDYDCSGWSEDSSVFTPPSNVTFDDIGSMIQPSGGQSMESQCSVCDSLIGEEKAQCRAALNCN